MADPTRTETDHRLLPSGGWPVVVGFPVLGETTYGSSVTAQSCDRVSAEVTPRAGQARRAATALQELGFRVLHIGSTISVDAPESSWTRVFGVSFRAGVPAGDVAVPETLRDLVIDVWVVPPPDLHR